MKVVADTQERCERSVLDAITPQMGVVPALTREYQTIFKNNGKPMVIIEEDATITLVNAEFEKLSGYTKEEIEGKKSWMEFVARDDRRRVKEYHHLRRSDPILSPRCFEFRFLNRNGKVKNVVLTIGQIPGTSKNMASLLDVTDRRQAEATLRVSEERYKAIFENSRDAIYITTADGTYIDANHAALDLFGYTREEMKKVNAGQLYADPADARRFQKEIEEKGFVRDFEVQLLKKDKTVMDCLLTVTAQRGDDGGILEYQGIIRDITERKRAEDMLRESEERYRTLVDNVNLGVNLIDADHNVVMTNAAQGKQFNKPASEMIGKKCFREFEKRDAVCPHCPGIQAMATGQPAEVETVGVRDDGSCYNVRIQAFPAFGHDGTVTGFIEISEDITERKQAEESLRQERETFATILENALYGVGLIDKEVTYLYLNPEFTAITGYTLEDIPTGRDWMQKAFPDKEYRCKIIEAWKKDSESTGLISRVFSVVCKDGGIKEIEFRPTLLADGRSIVMLADITERKRAEEALRASEQHYRTLFEESLDGICLADAETGIIIDCNRVLTNLVCRERAELIGKPQIILHPPRDDQEKFSPTFKQHLTDKEGQIIETQVITRTGDIREVEIKANSINFRGRKLLQGVFRDITERKRAEEALRESEKRFRLLVEHSKDALLLHDFDGTIIDANQHACDSLGYTREELLGLSIQDIDEDAIAGNHKGKWEQMVLGQPITLEGVHRRKDGTIFPVEIRLGVLESGGRRLMLGMVRDVTERKQAEERLQRYAADLERSSEEVKNFAYIVSHDLRVPLVNLKGYSSELRSALQVIGSNFDAALPHLSDEKRSEVAMALHEDVPEALEFITNSVSRMDGFINSILLLSRLGRRDLKPESIDMNAVVQETLKNLAHQIQERGITVKIGSLPPVVADRTAMEQIIGNILGNAVKYLDAERPGQIEVGAATNNGEMIFSIRDNGRGIAQEDMDKVFAPFRRAGKQDTPGEGMGLAYVQTLVRRHGGRIWCESELGKGTVFTFTISNSTAQGAHDG
jgi:PAS domain S-box-containing protein